MQEKETASQGFVVGFHLVIVMAIVQLFISHYTTSKTDICLARGYVLSFFFVVYFTLCPLGISITPYLYFKGDFAWCTIILPLKQYDHSIKTATKQQSSVVSVCLAFALKLFGSFLRFEDGH